MLTVIEAKVKGERGYGMGVCGVVTWKENIIWKCKQKKMIFGKKKEKKAGSLITRSGQCKLDSMVLCILEGERRETGWNRENIKLSKEVKGIYMWTRDRISMIKFLKIYFLILSQLGMTALAPTSHPYTDISFNISEVLCMSLQLLKIQMCKYPDIQKTISCCFSLPLVQSFLCFFTAISDLGRKMCDIVVPLRAQ